MKHDQALVTKPALKLPEITRNVCVVVEMVDEKQANRLIPFHLVRVLRNSFNEVCHSSGRFRERALPRLTPNRLHHLQASLRCDSCTR
jgi:hypothetical protein